ncbi:MAG: PrsW family intramembrane metalloprotease, partial [Actinomycetota bacterium]|nr:PrsW family intramembrane metalloprotease [Actinomycetota bacterium]
ALPPPPTPAEMLPAGHLPLARRARGPRTWQVLAGVLAALVLALLGLVLLVVLVGATGIVGFLVGTTLAAVPAVMVVAAFLWVDRWEPEPRGLLVGVFAWGAVVAALVSAFVNTAAMQQIAIGQGRAEAMTLTPVLVAPVVEEVTKGLGVLLVVLIRRREFDGLVDGVVCAGLAAVGFAFTENILYFGRAFLQGEAMNPGTGIVAASVLFIVRGVLSPFAHPLFTVATGIGLGIAATTSRGALRVLAPLLGLAVAITLHAAWNLGGVAGARGFFTGYFVVMVPLFLLAVALVTWLRTREGRLIATHLPVYAAAGWIPPYDVAMVATMAGRRRARTWAKAWLGKRGERAMKTYQATATELAFLRDRASRADVPDFPRREHALLQELTAQRTVLAGAGAFPG